MLYKRFFKRIIDFLASLVMLIVLSPILLITSLLIKIDSKGPIIFKQERVGKDGKIFSIYKFRSMVVNAEKDGVYCEKGDSRVTRVGRFLRASSIDELPQLVNILKGDMSFIGPRPPLTYHPWPLDEYSPEQFRMFEVRPGITGWAQVNGRKNVEWNRRILLNVWYIDNLTFALDIKIAFMTVFKVLRNDDNDSVGVTVAQNEEKSNIANESRETVNK